MAFILNNSTPNVPRLTDILNFTSGGPPDFFRLFTYAWTFYLGGWFFAGILGGLAAALYLKSQNVVYPIVFFIISLAVMGPVLQATPSVGNLPSAAAFMDLVGVLIAFAVGFIVYTIYRESR